MGYSMKFNLVFHFGEACVKSGINHELLLHVNAFVSAMGSVAMSKWVFLYIKAYDVTEEMNNVYGIWEEPTSEKSETNINQIF